MRKKIFNYLINAINIAFIVVNINHSHAQSLEQQVIDLVNQERWDNGALPPLKYDPFLETAASSYAQASAERNFLMHCDPDTQSIIGDRVTAAGYTNYNTAGENLAAGTSFTTAQAVMNGWMGSFGHRENILATRYSSIGVGYFFQNGDQANVRSSSSNTCTVDASNGGPYKNYWVQNFGNQRDVYPLVIEREAYLTNSCDVSIYLYGPSTDLGAVEYRLSQDTQNWTEWETYTPETTWIFTGSQSTIASLFVDIRDAFGQTYSASDEILLNLECGVVDPIFSGSFESLVIAAHRTSNRGWAMLD